MSRNLRNLAKEYALRQELVVFAYDLYILPFALQHLLAWRQWETRVALENRETSFYALFAPVWVREGDELTKNATE